MKLPLYSAVSTMGDLFWNAGGLPNHPGKVARMQYFGVGSVENIRSMKSPSSKVTGLCFSHQNFF